MSPRILAMGGAGVPLLFAHANGFPPQSYRQLLEALQHRFAVTAVEHRPLWSAAPPPRRLRWRVFADDLLEVLERFPEPPWVMGHSMGALTALIAADRSPQRIAGLLLLDPVLLPDRQLLSGTLARTLRSDAHPLVRSALRRPQRFASLEEAWAFYRGKRAFSGLSDQALWDYVLASKERDEDGALRLRYPREWEAAIYLSVPRARSLLKRLQLPTLGVRGEQSATLGTLMWQRWSRWQPGATLMECPGGHLFPLEHPQRTAELVLSFVSDDAGPGNPETVR